MPTSPRKTELCHYRYDPLNRLTDSSPYEQAAIQRFYCKTRLATEIQGTQQRGIVQHEDQLLAQRQCEGVKVDTTLLATDQQRSVLHALDATSPRAFAYTPYGHRPMNGLLSLLGFNGERPDPVTGHYHLGNGYRPFNSVLMCFTSPDSWSPFGEGGLNAYAYCAGDPINRVDPTGHMFKLLKALRSTSPPRTARAPYPGASPLPSRPELVLQSSPDTSEMKLVDIFKSGKGKRTLVYQEPNGVERIEFVPKNKPGIESLRKVWERNPELKPTRIPPPNASDLGPKAFPLPLDIDFRRPVAEGSNRASRNNGALRKLNDDIREKRE